MTDFKAQCASGFGFICFSRSYESPVQWGHYAEKHKGICIGFDVEVDELHPIKYTDYRLEFDPALINTTKKRLSWLVDFFVTKHRHWEYEQEERIIVGLDLVEREGDLYFASFEAAGIKVAEVIVGCNSKISRAAVFEALGDNAEGVDVFKVRPGFGEFKIVRNKNENLWV
ncbi:hypothetical protein D3C77_389730 [compost metagenome]